MPSYRMVYKGTRKISAIKAVRRIAGIGLKEAKDAIENPSGMIVYGSSCAAILSEYVGSTPDSSECKFDWAVGENDESMPTDLRGMSPHMDAVMSSCRGL